MSNLQKVGMARFRCVGMMWAMISLVDRELGRSRRAYRRSCRPLPPPSAMTSVEIAVGQELDIALLGQVLDMGHEGMSAAAAIFAVASAAIALVELGARLDVAVFESFDVFIWWPTHRTRSYPRRDRRRSAPWSRWLQQPTKRSNGSSALPSQELALRAAQKEPQ